MPTNTNAYNSRVTDEALEKRFRDTFRAQGGAELVDDLYAQGVIVPVVDFTAAATGQQLAQNLQTAWDFSTGYSNVQNTSTTIVSNAGFWQVDLICSSNNDNLSNNARIYLSDGLSTKPIWEMNSIATNNEDAVVALDDKFVVFLRSGDTLVAQTSRSVITLDIWYRQIATVNGDLVNPTGFTSS